MFEYEIQRTSRKCAMTDRELGPGELFYSVLSAEGSEFVRTDYSREAWQGPPENAIGWWKARIPDLDQSKVNWAPDDVILNYFEQLDGFEDQNDKRYVLALLMLRRRMFRLEESQFDEQTGEEFMVVSCPRNELEYTVPVTEPDAERAEQIQAELLQLLFGESA